MEPAAAGDADKLAGSHAAILFQAIHLFAHELLDILYANLSCHALSSFGRVESLRYHTMQARSANLGQEWI
ncbi:hypothetical protein D3C71_1891010 [compost metagenome]